jgi:YidC/Oxa1 family membrane protein insertase
MGHFFFTLFIFPIAEIIEIAYYLLYRATANYGLSVIGLSFVVTLASLPIYIVAEHWQDVERRKVMQMAPKVKKIKRVFSGDEQFMILSAYYRENHYKPIYALRSSFSILIQIPFFFAAYAFLSKLGALKGLSFLFVKDMGSPDGLLHVAGKTFNLLPIVMTAINCVSGAVYSKGHQAREKVQIYGMAGIFLVILYNSPAGLLLYWTMNNILSLVKNVFYKLKHPLKTLYVVLCLIAGAIVFFIWKKATLVDTAFALVLCVFAFILLLPVLFFLMKRYYHAGLVWLSSDNKIRNGLFSLSMVGIVVLVGLLIPLNLIASSPTEFSFLGGSSSNPLSFIGTTLVQAVGCFFIWPICLYHLFDKRIQSYLSLFGIFLFLGMIIDAFVFPADYGIISVNLIFTNMEAVKIPKMQTILNLFVLLSLFVVLALLFAKKHTKWVSFVLTIALLALSGMSVYRMVSIEQVYKDFAKKQETSEGTTTEALEPLFTFSRNGKNVLVLMLDRAISSFVPDIFAEDPALLEDFSGFTFYPNTISFGQSTIYGAPPLFGGYEYTPLEMQRKSDQTMKDKTNESLLVLPKLFSSKGYSVEVANPPWSNYSDDFDGTPFDGIPNVKADGVRTRYVDWWRKNYFPDASKDTLGALKSNLLRYSLFESSPVIAHKYIYNDGKYMNEFNSSTDTNLTPFFIREYATMVALPSVTQVTDDGNYYNTLDSDLTHEPVILQIPDYTPSLTVNNDGTTPYADEPHYHVDAAAFRLVAKWFQLLKDEGAYDNTRIIIVSDHGGGLAHDTPDDFKFASGQSFSQFHALLMVKDFGASGVLRTDNALMTVADVPALAVEKLIDEPKNPSTGEPLSLEMNTQLKKKGVTITDAVKWRPSLNGVYQFTIDDNEWLTVHDDVFKKENWSVGKNE